jgi:glutathione S-transferase
MKLYSFPGSPNALRSRAVVFELELPVEIVDVNMMGGENKSPEFLALNPNGKVPTLVDGDYVLWESRAINAYLASKAPARNLYPDDAKLRGLSDQWSNWQAIHFGPALQAIAFERVQKKLFGMGEPDEAAIAGHLKTAADLLPILEKQLEGKQWVVGELSLADFALGTNFILRGPGRLGIEAYPNITAWLARLEARPGWVQAITPWRTMMQGRGVDV